MNILVFDTETTNLEKPFCYNVGYVIYNVDENKVVLSRDFVIEQVWHNSMLFTTSYYADKRELYVSRMKGRKATLDKWGYVMQRLYRDIVEFEITNAYAYNCKFDEKVFAFNCDWFKTINPIEHLQIHDIRGYVCEKIVNDDYVAFCEELELFTESGNYSTTAETVFKYVSGNVDFIEEHTALADSVIECEILAYCVNSGCEWNTDYNIPHTIPRNIEKTFVIVDTSGEQYNFVYTNKRKLKGVDGFRLYKKENTEK